MDLGKESDVGIKRGPCRRKEIFIQLIVWDSQALILIF
jgi:hypothetical protein